MHPDHDEFVEDTAELEAQMRARADKLNAKADEMEAKRIARRPESARERAKRLRGWSVIGGIAAFTGTAKAATWLRNHAMPVTAITAAAGGAAATFVITPVIDRPRPNRPTVPPAALPAPPPIQVPIPTPTPNPTPTVGSTPAPGLGPTVPTGAPTLPTEPIPTPPLTPPVDVTPTPEPPIDGKEPPEPMVATCLVDWQFLGLDLLRALCRELPPAPGVPTQGRTRAPAARPAESSPETAPPPSWTEAPPTSSPTPRE